MAKKPLVVVNIPNHKAMHQIAKHLGYGTETLQQFKGMAPEHFPAYIEEYKPKKEHFWGSNINWIPEYRYNHVDYQEYIKEHNLPAKEYSEADKQRWLSSQIKEVMDNYRIHFS